MTETTITPDAPESGLPPELERAAAGEATRADEQGALDWLLGATTALEYDLPVDYDTPAGMKKLIFRIRQLDTGVIDAVDEENRKGDGPFSKLDVPAFNAALVTKATVYIMDEAGEKVAPTDARFLGGVPAPHLAMALRFKNQGGLLEGIADQVRRVSGYSNDRVGTAQRAVVSAGKSS